MAILRREKRTVVRPKRRRGRALLIASFCMAAGVAQLQLAAWPQSIRVAVLVVCFVSALACVAYAFSEKFLNGYRCQECGARCHATISPIWAKDGDPVRYICKACDIEWDTGSNYSTPND